MKRTLSLAVAVLLALALIPFGGLAKAKPYAAPDHSDAFDTMRSGMSERELRWAGLDDASLESAKVYMERLEAQKQNPSTHDYNWDEVERLRPFYFDEITSETADQWLPFNIDRRWGYMGPESEMQDTPELWFEVSELGSCFGVTGMWGYLGGFGMYEGDLDVSDFEELNHIIIYPNYIRSINASNCPSLERVTLSYYDGFGGMYIYNDPYYNGYGDWDPDHHTEFIDLSNCPSLQLVQISYDGLTSIDLEGSLGDNIEELYLAYNRLSGPVPDLSEAHNLLGFAIPENHYSGNLEIDSPAAQLISTEEIFQERVEGEVRYFEVRPNYTADFGSNDNFLTDIRFDDSFYGPLHFGVQNGYVAVDALSEMGSSNWGKVIYAAAYPDSPDAVFEGWYDPEGNLVSTDQILCVYKDGYVDSPVEMIGTDLTAVFTSGSVTPLEGDVDMDGTLTAADALLAMRQAMGILQLSDAQLALADFDGNGVVDISDALLIMRRSMGLI